MRVTPPTPIVFVAAVMDIAGGRKNRSNHNKAACAPANKLARICYAVLLDRAAFDQVGRRNKKIERTAFAFAA
jgi:hypothetical protein